MIVQSMLTAILFAILLVPEAPAQAARSADGKQPMPLFLDLFRSNQRPATVTTTITVNTAVGPLRGYLARPDTAERLPAILLIPGEEGLNDWMKENARDLSGIGYVALALEPAPRNAGQARGKSDAAAFLADEPTLARLAAAVRWLRRRPDVFPDRIGVAGWSVGADQALALAATTPLQACAFCDASVVIDSALFAGLRGTPLLGIFAGKSEAAGRLPNFEKALTEAHIAHRLRSYAGVSPGFMTPDQAAPAAEAAGKAYFEIYEFFAKFVEDADIIADTRLSRSGPAKEPVATIADIMRSVNQPTGVHGDLLKSLKEEPADRHQWHRVRADAALIAEAAQLLEKHDPPRGKHDQWLEQCRAFGLSAKAVVAAADRRDYQTALSSSMALKTRCAACHDRHR